MVERERLVSGVYDGISSMNYCLDRVLRGETSMRERYRNECDECVREKW